MTLAATYNELSQVAFDPPADATAEDARAALAALLSAARVKSALPGVTDEAWATFVDRMAVAPFDSVSASNTLGAFRMTARRLRDMGVVAKLTRSTSQDGRTIWVAEFVAPMTARKFLTSSRLQYTAFAQSMQDYAKKIADGKIIKDAAMSLSGALAILHRAGPHGLERWAASSRFATTEILFRIVDGIF